MKKTEPESRPEKVSKSTASPRKSRKSSISASAMETADTMFATPPETWSSVLEARAQALAQRVDDEVIKEYIEVVVFLLAYETYCVETAYVREVYPLKDLTPLPGTPSFVAGIINVRGQVLSVIDIRDFFGLPKHGLSDLNKVIILTGDGMEFGILADAIVDVRNIPVDEIQPGLPTLSGIREDYLKGISAEQQVILDAKKLLTDNNIVVHEEVI